MDVHHVFEAGMGNNINSKDCFLQLIVPFSHLNEDLKTDIIVVSTKH